MPAGVYRVVGVGEGVTLLWVADADGRRANAGEVVVGSLGRGALPDPVPTLLTVAGVLALAYVGAGSVRDTHL